MRTVARTFFEPLRLILIVTVPGSLRTALDPGLPARAPRLGPQLTQGSCRPSSPGGVKNFDAFGRARLKRMKLVPLP